MQKQHQHLHTQEKILRYELAQKRKLLTELKEELEYCREKWLQAREKNTTTEAQWKQLRTEFASRKATVGDDFSNSLESGYSDERESSSTDEEEPGYDTDVSESHNKVSSPEPVSEDVLYGDGDKTDEIIVDVVRDEIAEIENENVVQEVQEVSVLEEKEDIKEVEAETVVIAKKEASSEMETEAVAPSTSKVTTEERASARDERLRRLEEETKLLMNKVSKTTLRSWQLDVKLENLHEKYGDGSSVQNSEETTESEDSDEELA